MKLQSTPIPAMKLITTLVLLASLCPLFAADHAKPAADPFAGAFFPPELVMLARDRIALTPEQQQKIRPVVDNGVDRIQDCKRKRTGELIEIISGNYDDLKVFLTPEQLKKLEEMRQKTLIRIQSRMQEKL